MVSEFQLNSMRQVAARQTAITLKGPFYTDRAQGICLAFAVQGFTKLPSMPWLARNRVVMLAVSVSGIARKRLLEPVPGNLNDVVRSEEEMCRYTLRVQCAPVRARTDHTRPRD
jgi:hypothetical protein